jgi:hypothetical protein
MHAYCIRIGFDEYFLHRPHLHQFHITLHLPIRYRLLEHIDLVESRSTEVLDGLVS